MRRKRILHISGLVLAISFTICCGTIAFSNVEPPKKLPAKLVSIGHPDKRGDQSGMLKDAYGQYRERDLGRTGFWKVGDEILVEHHDQNKITRFVIFFLATVVGIITSLLMSTVLTENWNRL